MPKDRWFGFIKDYDGGTLMECYIYPHMDYLRVPEVYCMDHLSYLYFNAFSLLDYSQTTSIYYEQNCSKDKFSR